MYRDGSTSEGEWKYGIRMDELHQFTVDTELVMNIDVRVPEGILPVGAQVDDADVSANEEKDISVDDDVSSQLSDRRTIVADVVPDIIEPFVWETLPVIQAVTWTFEHTRIKDIFPFVERVDFKQKKIRIHFGLGEIIKFVNGIDIELLQMGGSISCCDSRSLSISC